MNLAIDQQRELIRSHMQRTSVNQSQLATMIGRSQKHVSRVLTGKAGTAELDYWAFILGMRFVVTLEPTAPPADPFVEARISLSNASTFEERDDEPISLD